jgi:hypothetical protein
MAAMDQDPVATPAGEEPDVADPLREALESADEVAAVCGASSCGMQTEGPTELV